MPAPESRIENGVPDCKMVMPLIAHPPSAVRFAPVARSEERQVVAITDGQPVSAVEIGQSAREASMSLSSL